MFLYGYVAKYNLNLKSLNLSPRNSSVIQDTERSPEDHRPFRLSMFPGLLETQSRETNTPHCASSGRQFRRKLFVVQTRWVTERDRLRRWGPNCFRLLMHNAIAATFYNTFTLTFLTFNDWSPNDGYPHAR